MNIFNEISTERRGIADSKTTLSSNFSLVLFFSLLRYVCCSNRLETLNITTSFLIPWDCLNCLYTVVEPKHKKTLRASTSLQSYLVVYEYNVLWTYSTYGNRLGWYECGGIGCCDRYLLRPASLRGIKGG